jgi:hypothetical protein
MLADTLVPVRCDRCPHRSFHSLSWLALHWRWGCPRGCGPTLRLELSRGELWARIAEAVARDSLHFEL